MSGRIYAASLVALYRRITATVRIVPLLALVATTTALVAFIVQYPTAAMWALVVALVLSLAAMVTLVAEVNDTTDWANAAERRAVDAEHLVDALNGEAQATHAANEILCAELAASDQQRIVSDGIIARLRGDVLDAQMRLADALNEAAEAPAPVIPLVPRQRDGSEYEWPDIAREIQTDDLAALMRAMEEK